MTVLLFDSLHARCDFLMFVVFDQWLPAKVSNTNIYGFPTEKKWMKTDLTDRWQSRRNLMLVVDSPTSVSLQCFTETIRLTSVFHEFNDLKKKSISTSGCKMEMAERTKYWMSPLNMAFYLCLQLWILNCWIHFVTKLRGTPPHSSKASKLITQCQYDIKIHRCNPVFQFIAPMYTCATRFIESVVWTMQQTTKIKRSRR